MRLEDLLIPTQDWVPADIQKDTKGKLWAFRRKQKPINIPGHENKWTYVYTINEEVKYIGNTESDLKKRVLPELNQAAAVKGILKSKGKLAYTNIRLSQLLLAEIEKKRKVKLYYTNRYDWKKEISESEVTINNDSQNFCFDHKFLLCWHPSILQPGKPVVSIETALILRHIQVGNQLPPWNLGLG